MARPIELNLQPDPHTLRQFGWIALVVFATLAACAWFETWMFRFGLGALRVPVAGGLLALGVWSAGCSLVQPRANRALFVALSVLGYPFGLVASYVVLALLFFGVFMPAGLLLRAFGRDPMQRKFARDAKSYWQKAHPPRDKASYFRQF
jgi:hypothetical protein